ncbi:MAG: CapA family protein [Candidatus Pacebacteria bacterium]|nr:CapA family protein [Candidatus Paceibacterota bacterium]
MEVPFYKKFLKGAFIFIGIFGIGVGGGYMIENMHSAKLQKAALIESQGNLESENSQNENGETSTESAAGKNDSLSAEQKALLADNSLPEVKLTFTGDISLSGSVKTYVKNKLDGDYEKVFGAATPILQKGDITFGTFNGTFGVNDSNKTETKTVAALRGVGFDVVGTSFAGANRTIKNLIETTLVIDGNGLTHAGAGRSYLHAREPKLIEKNGMTIGYLTFTDNKTDWPLATETEAGLLWANDPQIEEIIANGKAKADVLVVSFNWADKAVTHTLRQELLAHTAIDAGATVVIGHYGSNLHDVEYYHGGLIAYNLGNLVSASGTKPKGIQGLILETGIRGGVINTVAAYGAVENQNGFIDSVSPISMESLIRDKGVVYMQPEEIVKTLPTYVASEIVTRGPKVNKVAITIDDGWSVPLVKKALDVLSTKGAKATFFTVGSITDANRLNFIRAVTNGIELGNHTDSHGWLTQMNEAQIAKEMDTWQTKTDAALDKHYETQWFRPPFMAGFAGHTKTAETVTATAKAKNMKVALWNIDPFSGISMKADTEAVTNFVVGSAKQGSIILLHFTQEHMAALPAIIDGLRAKGLEPVTLSELFQ